MFSRRRAAVLIVRIRTPAPTASYAIEAPEGRRSRALFVAFDVRTIPLDIGLAGLWLDGAGLADDAMHDSETTLVPAAMARRLSPSARRARISPRQRRAQAPTITARPMPDSTDSSRGTAWAGL